MGGSHFCGQHGGTKWEAHGRVDGPIPQKKLDEFKRQGTRGGGAPKEAAPRKAAAKQAAGSKSGPSGASSSGAAGSASAAQKRPRESSAPPAAAAKASTPPPSAAAGGSSGASKASSKEPAPKKLKCTCGCPIHTEKCKLFKPSTAFTTTTNTTYDPRFGRVGEPQPPRFASRPEAASDFVPPRKVAPPVAFVYDWAREQVAKIAMEVKANKPAERKTMYKKMLLEYHPDKRSTMGSRSEGRTDAELNEVVMDLKRRIDNLS